MNKAVVVGGSNGLGLAISILLIKKGYFIEILDLVEPSSDFLPNKSFRYTHCNLADFDESLLVSFSNNFDVKVLVITAGIGRIADFQFIHIGEIEKTFRINTISTIKILSIFYKRILSKENFLTCVIGSISGWLSSPAASVYSASKAAICRFIESVNIELEVNGYENRILDVSPACFKGSRFYGGKNDLNNLIPLASKILNYLRNKESIFIPNYNEKFKSVIDSYHNNPHTFGLNSYNYKLQSSRIDNSTKVKIGYLSGTFDLFHIGHLNLLRRAKESCDYLIVGVHNNGKWKGKSTFIPLNERKEVVASCKYVDMVVDSCREDSDAWKIYKYNLLFVGSDYKDSERFKNYEKYFQDKAVKIIYFPYTTSTSSTELRDLISRQSLS